MPEVAIGFNAINRRAIFAPRIRVTNFLAERDATNQYTGVTHIQRPGLTRFAEVGSGPIRGVFRQAGTFSGDFLVASGEALYRVNQSGSGTLMDDLPGTDLVGFAATQARAILVSDGDAWSTTGATLTQIVMPDARKVTSVAQLNGYFILPDAGSARFYWIAPAETNPDGLSFASTESVPGVNLKVERVGDELWFFKDEGVEVWVPTGDPDLPFQRVPGRNYDKGCRARDTVVRFDNAVVWVGNDGLVYRGDNAPAQISTHSVEEQIRRSATEDLKAWTFACDGHTLYCLTTSGGTWVYDASSQFWSEFASYERQSWRAHVGDIGETFTVCGDDELGLLYRIDPEASNDDGAPLQRILTGGIPVPQGALRCDTLNIFMQTGTTGDPNLFPNVRIRWSDDLETYGSWEDVFLGGQGDYGRPVTLTRLGMMRYPGRLFEIMVTDDAPCSILRMSFNEDVR